MNGNFCDNRVIKKGRSTNKTQGIIYADRAIFRYEENGRNYDVNCYEIRDDIQPFCEDGDSGSAVFVIDSESLRKIPLGIAFYRFTNSTYVCDIREFVTSLKWKIYQLQEARVS